jgi:hypothetical protein
MMMACPPSKPIDRYAKAARSDQSEAAFLLLRVHRELLDAAVRHDAPAVEGCLSLLEQSLDAELNPRLSLASWKLFAYLRHSLADSRFDEVARVSQSLLFIWSTACEHEAHAAKGIESIEE